MKPFIQKETPVIQVVGYKRSGKTTLVCELVRLLGARGCKAATVKRHGHDEALELFDTPDTDTWRHRQAGACASAIASPGLSAMWEAAELTLPELVARLPAAADIVIAEGFKSADYAKWVLLRSEADVPLLTQVTRPVGVTANFPFSHPTLPVVPPRDYEQTLQHILRALGLGI